MPTHLSRGTLSPAAFLVLAGLAASCTGSVPVSNEDHDFVDTTDVDLGTAPWRARRRMDIDQLDHSIREVSGGIGWESVRSDGTVSQRYFDTYAESLGVPDYVNSSTEDLSVSLLFAKFLDDSARSVCRRLADREGGSGAAYDGEAQGTFAPVDVNATDPAPADVDAALASALLRFHGRSLEPSSEQLQPWRDLHARLAETADPPRRAWEGVCVALITHPDFFTY